MAKEDQGEWKLLKKMNNVDSLLKDGNVIIKKNSPTEIWTLNVHISVPTNRGLQKAGCGDVLAGLCVGYLAQGLSLLEAAKKATATGNRAADILTRKKRGYHFLASDILEEMRRMKRKQVM